MKNLFAKFIREEDGATVVEYVIMIAIVAAIVLFAFPSLRKGITTWITNAFSDIGGGMEKTHNDFICPDGSTVKDLASCK